MAEPARRQLPHNLQAEEAVIGVILFAGRTISQVAGWLKAEAFYHPAHRAIFEAMLALDGNRLPIDTISVADQMKRAGTLATLKAYNGEAYLVDLSTKIATVDNVKHHARLVYEAAQVRQLIQTCSDLMSKGYDGQEEPAKLIADAQRAIGEIGQQDTGGGPERLRHVLHRSIKGVEDRYKYKRALTGIPTGYVDLDELTAGLQPGHLVIVGARPAMGKSALAGEISLHAACPQTRSADPAYQDSLVHPVLSFTLEMPETQVVERYLCTEARVDSKRLQSGFLETRDWIGLTKAAAALTDAPIWLDEQTRTLTGIVSRVRQWVQMLGRMPESNGWGLPLVVIDYLQLVSNTEGAGRNSNREQEIASISRALKHLAVEIKGCVVALAQINRGVEGRSNKRPIAADLRESGSIEADADVILLLYRDEVYDKESPDPGVCEVIIGKQRGGALGTVYLAFQKEYTRFESLKGYKPQAKQAPPQKSKGWRGAQGGSGE